MTAVGLGHVADVLSIESIAERLGVPETSWDAGWRSQLPDRSPLACPAQAPRVVVGQPLAAWAITSMSDRHRIPCSRSQCRHTRPDRQSSAVDDVRLAR